MELKDRFGRRITYVRMSVTDRCNLRCTYCMPETGCRFLPDEERLTPEEMIRIAGLFSELGIKRIRLTGGEPLVHPDIIGIAEGIKGKTGIEKLALTTNGMLLEAYLPRLAEAGVDSVNISLDTLDARVYSELTRGGDLAAVLSAIRFAASFEQMSVKINCVIRPDSDDMYVHLAQMAKEEKVCVRFIEMMPIGLGTKQTVQYADSLQERLEKVFGKGEQIPHRDHEGPAMYIHYPGFSEHIGFIRAMSHQFCDTCNRIRLTADGYLKTCLQYEAKLCLRDHMRQGATDDRLRELIIKEVVDKPAAHHFTCSKHHDDPGERQESRGMSGIGG